MATAKKAKPPAKPPAGKGKGKNPTTKKPAPGKEIKSSLKSKVVEKPITTHESDPDGLSPVDLRFVDEYPIDINGAKAMMRADPDLKYSSARVLAHRKLQNPAIRRRIAQRMGEISENCGVTVERVLLEQSAIAFSDIRKCFDEHGKPLAIADIDDITAAAIASIEVDTLYAGTGKDREEIGYTTKFKMWDKGAAGERLMKHLGLFKQDNEQKAGELSELIKLIQERSGKLPIKEQ
jgi:phage terminase small subunit